MKPEVQTQHLSAGQLRAAVDGEAGAAAQAHLAGCLECQARLTSIAQQSAQVTRQLQCLNYPALQKTPAPQHAWQRVHAYIKQKEKYTVFPNIYSNHRRSFWLAAILVFVFGVGLSFPQGRAWAGQFLNLFRIQEVRVLPLDINPDSFRDSEALGERFGEMLSDSVVFSRPSGEPVQVASIEEASQSAGFTVRQPAGFAAHEIMLQTGSAFDLTIDRARIQALVDASGRSDLQLSPDIDGAVISVDVPAGVAVRYGECPEDADAASPGCVVLAQMPSPTVSAPPNLDVAALAEIAMQIAGMSAEDARAFSQTVDWTSSLVIPIPSSDVEYTEILLDGAQGVQLTSKYHRSGYTLVWVRGGIVYLASGSGSPDLGIQLANSLP